MQSQTEKKAAMNGERDQKKKTFISERIVGRELSGRKAARYLLLSAACGLVFGLCLAGGFYAVRESRHLWNPAEETEMTAENGPETDTAAETGSVPGAAPEEAPEQSAAEETENGFAVSVTLDEETIRAAVRREVTEQGFQEENLTELLQLLQQKTEAANRSVVSVQALRRNTGWFNDTIETRDQASGLVLSAEGGKLLVLTSAAAVADADSLNLLLADGSSLSAQLLQSSVRDGIALLRAETGELSAEHLAELYPVKLAESDPHKTGSLVLAVGAPLGVVHSTDLGLIGYVSAAETTADGMQSRFYTRAAADPAHGTFYLNLQGELLGMAAQEDGGGQTEAAAVLSVSGLRRILRVLESGKQLPYLGVLGRTVSEEMKQANIPQGVFVTGLETESPAYQSGIQNGDVIVSVDGTQILNLTAYEAAVETMNAGEEITLGVMRRSGNGEYRELHFSMTAAGR